MRIIGLLLALALTTTDTAAAVRRVAVVVGNNDGGPSKPKLRYAERDARRVAQLLHDLGDVGEIELLLGASASQLRGALRGLATRHEDRASQLVFVFYYSGHADGRALLMGHSRLTIGELRRVVEDFPARTSVSIIDACQSGAATRAKGGRVVPIVNVRFDDRTPKGRITITSSAHGESSQESDTLQASFFTHYLLSGLRGAADDSADGKVSLEEAYGYAYRHTVALTSGTLHGPQHPSYAIDLKGAGQLVLTWLSNRRGQLVLPAQLRGTFFVRDAVTGALVAEVAKQPRRELRIALAAGRYRVGTSRGRDRLEQVVTVPRTGAVMLAEHSMVRERLQPGQAKGGSEALNLLSLRYELESGYLTDADLGHGVHLAYGRRVGPVELGVAVGYGHAAYERSDGLDVVVQGLSFFASLAWRYRGWRSIRPLVALDVGGSLLWQRARRAGEPEQLRRAPVFRYRLRAGAEVRLWRGLHLTAWGYAGQLVLERRQGIGAPFVGGFGAGATLDL